MRSGGWHKFQPCKVSKYILFTKFSPLRHCTLLSIHDMWQLWINRTLFNQGGYYETMRDVMHDTYKLNTVLTFVFPAVSSRTRAASSLIRSSPSWTSPTISSGRGYVTTHFLLWLWAMGTSPHTLMKQKLLRLKRDNCRTWSFSLYIFYSICIIIPICPFVLYWKE